LTSADFTGSADWHSMIVGRASSDLYRPGVHPLLEAAG
jgi:hypothetical protein